MGPGHWPPTMTTVPLLSNPNTSSLLVPKLRDDGSNWSNYEPHVPQAMGAKGLWLHVGGKAAAPKPYQLVNNIPTLPDGKTRATDDQIEVWETQIIDFDKHEYLVQHIILSTMSAQLSSIIKNLNSAHEMWDKVKTDATNKSTLFLINAGDQLASMCVADLDDPQTHLSKLKQHFELMRKWHDNLILIGLTISQKCFGTIIMSLLPPSYRSYKPLLPLKGYSRQ